MANRTDELKTRTKKFALRIIKVSRALPRCPEARVIGYQLLRSGTSVAAIIVRLAADVHAPNSWRKLELSSKRRTKLSFGWKC